MKNPGEIVEDDVSASKTVETFMTALSAYKVSLNLLEDRHCLPETGNIALSDILVTKWLTAQLLSALAFMSTNRLMVDLKS